jgi:hypothetical protein
VKLLLIWLINRKVNLIFSDSFGVISEPSLIKSILINLTGLDVVKLPDSLYSYQHLKAFGIHNHIYLDPWHVDAVFFVDEQWRIMKAVMQVFMP